MSEHSILFTFKGILCSHFGSNFGSCSCIKRSHSRKGECLACTSPERERECMHEVIIYLQGNPLVLSKELDWVILK